MSPERLRALGLLALSLAACGGEKTARFRADRPTSNEGTYRLVVEPPVADCRIGEPCALRVAVERADGGALPASLELEVDAAMPDHRHGLNLRPQVSGSAAEGFLVEGLLLHMPGYWEVYFDLTSGPVTERAQLTHGQ